MTRGHKARLYLKYTFLCSFTVYYYGYLNMQRNIVLSWMAVIIYLKLPVESNKWLRRSNESHCFRLFSHIFGTIVSYNRVKQWFLHFREDVIQLRPGTDVAQKHVVDLWSEIFLGDGVILQEMTPEWSHTYMVCVQVQCTGNKVKSIASGRSE